jgi:D-alanine-D-alanine ligase
MKKALIIHSPLEEDAPADELDVLQQVELFRKGLQALGFTVGIIPFPYDITHLEEFVKDVNPDFIVNLVETLFADGRLVHAGPFLFDHFKLPYTGSSGHAIYLSSHKILSKEYMKIHGIKTPEFLTYDILSENKNLTFKSPFLVKSLWEHASYGLDENTQLLFHTREELLERMKKENNPRDFFCEEYIHGREFNLSLLAGENGPEVLPPAEIKFNYPPEKARILGYKAKWEEDSFEYKNTVRTFQFVNQDGILISKLKEISMLCWKVYGLRGYARVDFRVDEKGNIYVLEINANPCISPDSGFIAAAHQSGIYSREIIRRIVDDIDKF